MGFFLIGEEWDFGICFSFDSANGNGKGKGTNKKCSELGGGVIIVHEAPGDSGRELVNTHITHTLHSAQEWEWEGMGI